MAHSKHHDPLLTQLVRDLALEGFTGAGHTDAPSQPRYAHLRALGTEPWLDTGDAEAAAAAWAPEVGALTTNNTLVNQVIQKGVLDGFVRDAVAKLRSARPDLSRRELIVEAGFLANARLALSLVQRFGVKVSVELHPAFAFDVDASVNFGLRYYEICPEYFIIKVPLTPDGFIVVRQLAARGVPVNYTLGFSARQNVLAACFSQPAFVNVFLGRLNAVVEDNGIGKPDNVGERVTLATWEALKKLRAAGRSGTRLIAASMRNGDQVALLAGVDVHTIPPKAAQQFLADDDPVTVHSSESLTVTVNDPRIPNLWQVCDRFEAFIDRAVAAGDSLKCGADLVALSRECGVDLFSEWTDETCALAREDGKIPVLSHWPADMPLDDLMSMAALQSFVVDQGALDDRLNSLID